jgi:hypothetical protein
MRMVFANAQSKPRKKVTLAWKLGARKPGSSSCSNRGCDRFR